MWYHRLVSWKNVQCANGDVQYCLNTLFSIGGGKIIYGDFLRRIFDTQALSTFSLLNSRMNEHRRGFSGREGGGTGWTRTSRLPSLRRVPNINQLCMFIEKVSIFESQLSASSPPQQLLMQQFEGNFLQLSHKMKLSREKKKQKKYFFFGGQKNKNSSQKNLQSKLRVLISPFERPLGLF